MKATKGSEISAEISADPNKPGEQIANDMLVRPKNKKSLTRLREADAEIAELAAAKTTVFAYWTKWKRMDMELRARLREIEQLQSMLVAANAEKLKQLMTRINALERDGLVKVDYKYRIKPGQIKKALRALGVRRGDTIFVHSKLSGLGYIECGIPRIIAELRDTIGERGTLAMPTFSQNYPTMIEEPYDPKKSLSTSGRITEALWRMPGVLRSDNPSHSIAAVGPRAKYLTAPHGNWSMFDRKGPFGRLYDIDARIIMLGCDIGANTMLHAVEAWALPYPPRNFVYAKGSNGRINRVVCEDFPEWCREWYGKSEQGKIQKRLFARKAIDKCKFGRGTIYAMSARKLVDACLEIVKKEPDVFLCDRLQCRTCWPCRATLVGWKVPDKI